jgi:hypothetical protein
MKANDLFGEPVRIPRGGEFQMRLLPKFVVVGRFVTATPEGLNEWLGREAAGEPLHVATPEPIFPQN